MLAVMVDSAVSDVGVDFATLALRMIRRDGVEYLRIVLGDAVFRLDVSCGSITNGPCRLTFLLAHDARLPRQIDTLRRLHAGLSGVPLRAEIGVARLSRLATALRVWDLRKVGTSLRQVADELWGPEEWPGPGEYRKSAVRRYVKVGEKLVEDGPRPILAMR